MPAPCSATFQENLSVTTGTGHSQAWRNSMDITCLYYSEESGYHAGKGGRLDFFSSIFCHFSSVSRSAMGHLNS
jgi:hypothetical protein